MAPRPRRLNGILRAGLVAVLAAGCGGGGPRPLALGLDVCDHCHMTLADARFAGELVSAKGLVRTFDDVGCLAAAVGAADPAQIGSLWLADFLDPDSLVAVERMTFIRTDSVRTPMSYGIVATRSGPAADSLLTALGGTRLVWADVVALASRADVP
ncbi:MAG: hypothetical protein AB7L66_03905 [Gemmatimonadales bacterium]